MDARAPHYQETREKVKKLLEGDQLSKRLQEFYAKQAAFHASMSRLVQVYRGVIETLPTREERQVLEDILAPYQVFLNNPLRTEPTGDNEADIAHIENVMNVRNEHFKSTLEALALTVSRNADFQKR